MSFNENLRAARERKHFTQQQVADLLGIDKSTYCGYETGKRQPDVPKLKNILKVLDVSGDELLETERKTTPNTAEAAPRAVDASRVEAALIELGLIEPGEDLSDEDLRFLLAAGEIVRAWFNKRK